MNFNLNCKFTEFFLQLFKLELGKQSTTHCSHHQNSNPWKKEMNKHWSSYRLLKFHFFPVVARSSNRKRLRSCSIPLYGIFYNLYCVVFDDKSVGVDSCSRSTIVAVWFDAVDGPGCDVCLIICLINSSWLFDTTPQSKQGNSDSPEKYFLCGCVKVYCCVTGWITAVVCVMLDGGNCSWYWCSVEGVNGGNRIWCCWKRCWRSVSVLANISLQLEQEYWICGMIVVTVWGVVWIEICDDVVGAWCDVSDGNGWSEKQSKIIEIIKFLTFPLTWMYLNWLDCMVLIADCYCMRLWMIAISVLYC